jgi:hypothetical protein
MWYDPIQTRNGGPSLVKDKGEARTDRQIGAALDQETVDRLRDAVVWMQKNRGLRLKDVAVGCDAAEHTVRNFAYGKAARPDNTFLGRLYHYLANYRGMIPSEIAWKLDDALGAPTNRRTIVPLYYEMIRAQIQLDENDLLRVYERYVGYYLCFSRSARGDRLVVSWLHLRALNPTARLAAGGVPMPRFTLYSRYPDRFDVGHADDYVSAGYVITRHGNIYFTGQRDGELRYMILEEPSARKFTYLEGLYLGTAVDDGTPFASRVMCQHLGLRVSRAAWTRQIGLFTSEELHQHFGNADVIERVLGAEGMGLNTRAD